MECIENLLGVNRAGNAGPEEGRGNQPLKSGPGGICGHHLQSP
jgi:hypothetical protein